MLSRQLADCYERRTPNLTHRKYIERNPLGMIGIKDQYFGTEIEMTGITRQRAAEVVAEMYGTRSIL